MAGTALDGKSLVVCIELLEAEAAECFFLVLISA